MNAYDRLRKVLETQAVQASVAADIKLLLPNEQANPPKGEIWAEFSHQTGKVRQSLGGGRKHYKKAAGLLQFILYAPEKTGNGPITVIADTLERWFSSQQYSVAPDGYVTLDDAEVNILPKPVNGNFCVLVSVTFDFHYRDPDAVG